MLKYAIREIIDTYVKYSEPNWDCYGALPLSSLSVIYGIMFVNNLHIKHLDFEVFADPDGSIGFDWPNRLEVKEFTISIDKGGLVSYYATLNGEKVHGDCISEGPISKELLDIFNKRG